MRTIVARRYDSNMPVQGRGFLEYGRAMYNPVLPQASYVLDLDGSRVPPLARCRNRSPITSLEVGRWPPHLSSVPFLGQQAFPLSRFTSSWCYLHQRTPLPVSQSRHAHSLETSARRGTRNGASPTSHLSRVREDKAEQ